MREGSTPAARRRSSFATLGEDAGETRPGPFGPGLVFGFAHRRPFPVS